MRGETISSVVETLSTFALALLKNGISLQRGPRK